MKLSTVLFSSTAFLFSMASSNIVLAAEKSQNIETETRTPTSITRTSSCSGSVSCSTSTSVSTTELKPTSSTTTSTTRTRFTENNNSNSNNQWSSWFNNNNSNVTKTFTETKTPTSITRTSSCKGSGSCSSTTSVSTTELTPVTNKAQTQNQAKATNNNAVDCSAFADAGSKLNGWFFIEFDFFGDYTRSELTPTTSAACAGKQYYQINESGYDGNKVTFRSSHVEGEHKSQPAQFTFWLRAADAYNYQSVDFKCTLSKRNATKLGKKLRTYPKQGVELKADQITKVILDGPCDSASVFSSVYGEFQIINVEASY
ncbi:hypothetical protein [Zooshikella sp. RANM57]|uniref:hypothetical protein n=1 Tax=Zooshikella sp. RANM57 TaxID=3425863 RepID=UPI003D6ECB55